MIEPFRGSTSGMTRRELRLGCQRIYRDVYVPKGTAIDALVRARAAALFGGPTSVLSGLSAAAILGTKWIPDSAPAEVFRRGNMAAPDGLVLRDEFLAEDEVIERGQFRLTSPARTAYDLGRRGPFVDAVARVDALLHSTRCRTGVVATLAESHRGARGIVQLRQVLAIADGGAESPKESELRVLLVQAGFPPPETQIKVFDRHGDFVARLDIGWRRWKVAVEYDGVQHWDDRKQRSRDIDRVAELEGLGWKVIRVSAELLRDRPEVVIARVRAALLGAN